MTTSSTKPASQGAPSSVPLAINTTAGTPRIRIRTTPIAKATTGNTRK